MATYRYTLICITLSLCFLFFNLSLASPPPLPKFASREFNPPRPERIVLPNGLTLYLLEDHELPLIKLDLIIKAGSQYEPADKVGMSALFGAVMAAGGSAGHAPEDIQRLLDTTGGRIGFSIGLESGEGSLSCRSSDFDRLFEVFADLLRHPRFRGDFLNLEKAKAHEGLRRMNDDPEEVCRREFSLAVYGSTHPYARVPDPETIDRIRRKDLLEAHARYFQPNAIRLAITGDFQSAAMKQLVQSALGDWPRTEVAYPAVPPVVPTAKTRLFYIQRSIDQSQIEIGHTGFARHDPDHFAWEVFNNLWGAGGFSRLFRIVRTQKGLAYSVGSAFSEHDEPGLIVAGCQTRGPQTTAAIQTVLDIMRTLARAPFTAQEINDAKESICNRFIEHFGSSAQIASEVMELDYHHYPADYLYTYTQHVAQVTREDLESVAQRYLQPDKSIILVAGDLSTFEKPLSVIARPEERRIPDYSEEEEPWGPQ